MDSYHKTGKIGNSKPKNEQTALAMANAIAYSSKTSLLK